MEDAVIAGAGPIGLACAVSAKRRGLDPLLLDAGVLVHSITRYPIGMTFFTTPERMEIGGHPLVCAGQKPTREEGLKYYRGVARGSLVHGGEAFPPTLKYRIKPHIENRIKAGEIAAHFGATVERIDARTVTIRAGRATVELPADRVYALTGYHPDFELFRRLGIALEPDTLRARLDPETLETNVSGIHMAGSISSGRAISEIFIENGRFDGEKIFSSQLPSSTAHCAA